MEVLSPPSHIRLLKNQWSNPEGYGQTDLYQTQRKRWIANHPNSWDVVYIIVLEMNVYLRVYATVSKASDKTDGTPVP